MKKTLLDICLNNKTKAEELYQWIGFDRNWDVIDLGDRYLRKLSYDVVQFSESKQNFDRWANSSEESYDLNKRPERRAFLKRLLNYKTSLNIELSN